MADIVHIIRLIEFAKYPGGRYKKYGPKSGEEFRNDVMVPALREHGKIIIDFTGIPCIGPSFMSEITDVMIYDGYLTHKQHFECVGYMADEDAKSFIKMAQDYRDEANGEDSFGSNDGVAGVDIKANRIFREDS